VVEHLLAKEDVASSSLVTRSSLRLKDAPSEGWSARRSLSESGLRSDASYGWRAAEITAIVMHSAECYALRLSSPIGIPAERALCRLYDRFETARRPAQSGRIAAYRRVRTMANRCLLRIYRAQNGSGIRTIPRVRFRSRIRSTTFPLGN
jgi:hypothetical protein